MLRQPRWYEWKICDFFIVRHSIPFSVTKLTLDLLTISFFEPQISSFNHNCEKCKNKNHFRDSGWSKSKLLAFHAIRIYSELSNSLAKLWWFKLKSHSWFIAVCWSVTVCLRSYFCILRGGITIDRLNPRNQDLFEITNFELRTVKGAIGNGEFHGTKSVDLGRFPGQFRSKDRCNSNFIPIGSYNFEFQDFDSIIKLVFKNECDVFVIVFRSHDSAREQFSFRNWNSLWVIP